MEPSGSTCGTLYERSAISLVLCSFASRKNTRSRGMRFALFLTVRAFFVVSFAHLHAGLCVRPRRPLNLIHPNTATCTNPPGWPGFSTHLTAVFDSVVDRHHSCDIQLYSRHCAAAVMLCGLPSPADFSCFPSYHWSSTYGDACPSSAPLLFIGTEFGSSLVLKTLSTPRSEGGRVSTNGSPIAHDAMLMRAPCLALTTSHISPPFSARLCAKVFQNFEPALSLHFFCCGPLF